MSDTRREFLKKAALLTGAASIAQLLPESIQRALAIAPTPGSTWLDAEHVVILMQENRSFDHALGMLRGVRGYNDPRAVQLPGGNLVWLQSNKAGETYAPFRLDIHNTKATWMHSLPHSWANQTGARNDGKHDQWLEWKRNSTKEWSDMPLTMGYHTRQDLPFYYGLADAFTVCDQNFCSSLTGTNPNRLFFWTGTIRQQQNDKSRALVWNDDMDYGTLNYTTFPQRLEKEGISWKCYQNEVAIDTGFEGEEDPWLSNFQDNPLEFFEQYNIHLYPLHVAQLKKQQGSLAADVDALQKQIAGLPAGDAHIDHLQKNLHEKQEQLRQLNRQVDRANSLSFEQLSAYQQSIHRKAFDNNSGDPDYRHLQELTYTDEGTQRTMKAPKGDVLHQFRKDVKSGHLPTVSWITAPENFSDHPSAPWYGAWFVSEVLDILTQNPEVWKKTIFILAYDENDGYFDHVPPFTAPNPYKPSTGKVSEGIDTRVDFVTMEQAKERNGFPETHEFESPIGLGFRVPLVIASPWSRGGYVNSQVFDHTSTLQMLEKFLSHKTGHPIRETNISDWRRTVCGDLSSVFRPYHGEEIAQPSFVVKDEFLESIHKAKFKKLPGDFKAMTAEEIAAFNKAPHLHGLQQEPGTRPSCALPYDLEVEGRLSADKTRYEIKFSNSAALFGDRTAGSPFNVYAPGSYRHPEDASRFEKCRNWAYGVKAGDSISDSYPLQDFEDGKYHLRVHGPNGFYREFKGAATDSPLTIQLKPAGERTAPGIRKTADAILHLVNHDSHAHTIVITDHGYGKSYASRTIAAGGKAEVLLPLASSHGWYDLSVRVEGSEGFGQRYAGRIETGRESISDPLMGRV